MSSSDTPVEYVTWRAPASSFSIEYSLPLFHEIDFFVNEGYRRIPHGGIELGGLLFGRAVADGIRIEAFQPIECEHASGPSFKMSERDVAALRKQIETGEPGLQVLGWFVAHTRSELQMNDVEAELFDELLPGPEKRMLLVKPEKFKSTRFTFLMHGARDGTEQAFVLPLPGRSGRAEKTPIAAAEPTGPLLVEKTAQASAAPGTAPVPAPPSAQAAIPPSALVTVPPVPVPGPTVSQSPASTASTSESRIERRRLARATQRESSRSKFGFAFILLLAGILGCGIGYWLYLQLPSAVIPLDLQPGQDTFTLSWPPELTRDAVYVAVRVNDSDPVLVSDRDRNSGHSEVKVSGATVKVELIARRWMRDSRGIVRYVR